MSHRVMKQIGANPENEVEVRPADLKYEIVISNFTFAKPAHSGTISDSEILI